MKNKILKTLLAISILINVGGYLSYNSISVHYDTDIKNKNNTISHLQDNVKTKSNQIAKLDSVIKLKNENVVKQQKVIDNDTKAINELKNKAKQLQDEKSKILAENFKKVKKGSDVEGLRPAHKQITVEASAYIAMCNEGCSGRTRTGIDVSHTVYYKGYRVIAVDTNLIPLNSLVKVETNSETFTAMAIDTGGAIRGNRIDILVSSESEAFEFGRHKATLTILKEGI